MNDRDEAIDRAIARALERDVASRPYRSPTDAEFDRALAALAPADQSPTLSVSESRTAADLRPERRYRGFTRAAAAAFAACLVCAAGLSMTNDSPAAAMGAALPADPAGAVYAGLRAIRL